ncbi:MAG: alpha/beta fold hydrolase [Trueperaceae bacterium]|nr:alpha/beta fold hydrolase [Trueperaceae bacterium]
MRRIVFVLLFAATASLLAAAAAQAPAQDPAQDRALRGGWEGSIDPSDLDLYVRVRFEDGPAGLTGEIDVPLQGAFELPLDQIETSADGAVRFTAPTLPSSPTFEGRLRGDDEIEGDFVQGSASVPFELQRAGDAPTVRTPSGWVGSWRGVLAPERAPLPLVLNLTSEDGRLRGTVDLPSQGLTGLEARPLAAVNGAVTLSIPALPADARLGLRLEDGALRGTFQQEGVTFPLTFVREGDEADGNVERPQAPTPPFPYATHEVTFDGDAGTLAGTLTLPEGPGPFPVVVLLNGSGAQDRDGTVLGHPTMAVLADRLARSGLGSLRWDDRGVGGSEGSLGAAGLDGLATDAAAAVTFLAGREDVDVRRIAVLGHSEGGLVAPLVVTGDAPVAAMVLLAAPAVSGLDVLELQNRLILGQRGAGEDEVDAQIRYLRALHAALSDGDTDEAQRLTRARVDEQLAALPESEAPSGAARERYVAAQVETVVTPTFRDFLLAQPGPVLRDVDVPTLAVFGRQDVQVPAVQNEGAMRAALREAGVDDTTVVTLSGLNHLMQPARVGGLDEYGTIRTTVAPELLDLVSEWLGARLLQ